MVMSSPYNIREGRNSYKEPMQQIGKERSVSFIYIYIYTYWQCWHGRQETR
ncbi:hypothetical protein CIPAW_07G224400 [Carya illinoinensis]|uniref:Uncharacterized protein n=1 Tax=Carya illinoinensis TaxID=32201 RepID=A0A8T1Q271_CARIL|nr:hypothetical protein CIPAW_07G224400 [Carya illinoinensis]